MLVEFLHEIMVQQTSLPVMDISPLHIPNKHRKYNYILKDKSFGKDDQNKAVTIIILHQVILIII